MDYAELRGTLKDLVATGPGLEVVVTLTDDMMEIMIEDRPVVGLSYEDGRLEVICWGPSQLVESRNEAKEDEVSQTIDVTGRVKGVK